MRYKAMLFDLDGTLYRQSALRRRMGARLMAACMRNPCEGVRAIRVVGAYRRAMEALRKQPGACADLGRAQLELAARWLGTDAELILPVVKDWMERRPLALLRRCARRGTAEVLRRARESGCRLAVVSDYPAEEKLRALGIRSFFNEVICAQDRDVQRLKPDPRGIELALLRLGVSRWEAIYVGDRPDLDAAAAASAGVACAIIGRSERMTRWNYLPISHLYELAEARP